MKKVYKLDEIDCANCAAKLENSLRKVKGLKDVSVSFMTQKLTLEIEESESVNPNFVIEEVMRICKKAEPDCDIRELK